MKLSIRLLALALLLFVSGCSGVALSWDQYNPNLGADDSVTSYGWTPDGYRTNR